MKPALTPTATSVKKRRWLLPVLLTLSLILPLISLNIGFYGLSAQQVWGYLLHGAADVDPNVPIIVRNIRIPRVIAAFAIGAGLAVAGAAFQGMFKNPLTSPCLAGYPRRLTGRRAGRLRCPDFGLEQCRRAG